MASWIARAAAGAAGRERSRLGSVFAAAVASLHAAARAALEEEIALRRPFLWLPVAAGAGVVVYFVADREPSLAMSGAAFAATAAVAVALRAHRGAFCVFLVFACLSGGFFSAVWRSVRADAPIVPRPGVGLLTAIRRAQRPGRAAAAPRPGRGGSARRRESAGRREKSADRQANRKNAKGARWARNATATAAVRAKAARTSPGTVRGRQRSGRRSWKGRRSAISSSSAAQPPCREATAAAKTEPSRLLSRPAAPAAALAIRAGQTPSNDAPRK